MADYKLLASDESKGVLKVDETLYIPNDPGNRHWQEYIKWKSLGGVPDPYIVLLNANDINMFRDRRLSNGFYDSITNKTYQCDDRSQGHLIALGASAGFGMNLDPQPTYSVITSDNSIIELNAAQLFQLINLRIMPWVTATIFYARQLKDNILNGIQPTDIEQGWP